MNLARSRGAGRGRAALRGAGLVLVSTSIAGCDGCSSHKPYTPFNLDGGPSASSVVSAVAVPLGSSSFTPVPAVAASGSRFELDSGSVDAPAGRVFKQGLAIDANNDGTKDLVAWVEATDGRAFEVTFTSGAERTHSITLGKLPSALLSSACKRTPSLAQIGATTVLATVVAACGGSASGGTSTYFTILRVGKGATPEVRLDGTANPLPSGESFSLAFSADDRDNDKNDDLTINVTLEGAGEPFDLSGKIAIPIHFVERPAGLARDATEPEAALTKLGGNVIAKGKVAKLAGDSFGDAVKLLRLATAVCEELGAPTLTTSAGSIRCGDTGFVGDAVYGVGVAAVTKKDWPTAVGILDLLSKLKLGRTHVKELGKALEKPLPLVAATATHVLTAQPSGDGVLSPLAFVGHDLLVAGASTSTLVKGDTLAEEASPAAPWPLAFAWFDAGMNFTLRGADRACAPRGWVLHEVVSDSTTDVRLPVIEAALPPKAIACAEAPLPLSVLVSVGNSAYVGVGSYVFKVETQGSGITVKAGDPPDASAPPSAPGQSRATDGSAMVLPIEGGVLVLGATPKRVVSEELKGARRCAVEQGGKRVACITARGGVVVDVP
ncbi:MAG: hypothetical protein U0414_20620, partial [Polyangiaceae bacterium]